MQSDGPIIHLPGSFNKVNLYYQGLSACVKQMVDGKGFNSIISALTYSSYASSQAMMCALVERWMDTTHTFHLPVREMTITLLDFTAIIGLSFSREYIPLSDKAYSST